MSDIPEPTDRELQILRVLWDREEATVREVYEVLREELPIVQRVIAKRCAWIGKSVVPWELPS